MEFMVSAEIPLASDLEQSSLGVRYVLCSDLLDDFVMVNSSFKIHQHRNCLRLDYSSCDVFSGKGPDSIHRSPPAEDKKLHLLGLEFFKQRDTNKAIDAAQLWNHIPLEV
jgi:hypothetical protein